MAPICHAGKTFNTFPLLFPSRIRQVILTINASTTSGRPSAVKCESQPLLCCESSCRRGSFRSRCTGGPVLHQAPPASEGDRGDTWRDNSQYNNNNCCHYGAWGGVGEGEGRGGGGGEGEDQEQDRQPGEIVEQGEQQAEEESQCQEEDKEQDQKSWKEQKQGSRAEGNKEEQK